MGIYKESPQRRILYVNQRADWAVTIEPSNTIAPSLNSFSFSRTFQNTWIFLVAYFLLDRIPDTLLDLPNFQGRVGKALLFGIRERQDGNALDTLRRNATRNTEKDIFLNAIQATDTGGNRKDGTSVVQDGSGNVGTRKAWFCCKEEDEC